MYTLEQLFIKTFCIFDRFGSFMLIKIGILFSQQNKIRKKVM